MKIKYFFPVLIFFFSGFKQGPYKVNEAIENFSLINAVDNNRVSLSDFGKSKVIVLVFSSPSCAFSKIYDDRLVALANQFQNEQVSFIFINPNNPVTDPEDDAAAMAKRAKEKGYSFPYLIDNNGKIATSLGASKTPEAFVLKKVNDSYIMKYKGAIDDNPQLPSGVTNHYLRDAIHEVLNNAPVKHTEKKPTGCMIKR